jgi:hypothetical protein
MHFPQPPRRVLAWLEGESLPITVFGLYVCGVLARLPDQLRQDGWLTLVGGREVARAGLPATDSLTAWTAGAPWVDQQWLAQLLLYRVASIGDVRLAMIVHAALLALALALALAAARWRGGTARSVALIAAPALVTILMSAQMRAQSFAYPLFVGVTWLLLADMRAPSRRVFLVFPMLLVWANLHGSVVVGAALVSLRGAVWLVKERRRLRGVVLTALPVFCVFASPYGLSLLDYYGSTAFNSSFGRVVTEWGPATPSLLTLPFYALAVAGIWLLRRHRSSLTGFEQLALLMLFAGGVLAVRNMVWFSYLAVVVLPLPLRERLGKQRGNENPRFKILVAAIAIAAVLSGGAAAAAQPSTWYEGAVYPDRAARSVADAAESDPRLDVYADVRYADWLLWRKPQLAGRVAYDARFELLSTEQLERLYRWHNDGRGHWKPAVQDARLIVLPRSDSDTVDAITAEGGVRRLYSDRSIVVLLRSSS